ncbi:hypothetical protein TNCV_3957951 [Trichonephila clavipes]|nr:hypothetical protein TNCV_3957951 [Trichonephila clavipes]
MSRSSVQSDVTPTVFKFPSKLGTYLPDRCSKDERLSRSYPVRTCGVEARNKGRAPDCSTLLEVRVPIPHSSFLVLPGCCNSVARRFSEESRTCFKGFKSGKNGGQSARVIS